MYCQRRRAEGKSGANNDRFCFSLNQDAIEHPTVIHADGSVPTYVHGSGIARLWSPKLLRWLTTKEKFASMGWPVTEDIAAALGVELFDVRT